MGKNKRPSFFKIAMGCFAAILHNVKLPNGTFTGTEAQLTKKHSA